LRLSADRERQMVSDASHELRTPIAVLKTQLELAHLAHGDAAALEAEITAAQRSVDRLAGLANGLLELSQVESAATETVSGFEVLAAELAGAIDRARLLAASAGITVDFEVDADAAPHDYAMTAENFGRLLSNLTSNAIAAQRGREGQRTGAVQVDLRQRGSTLVLTVSDDGPGIPEEFIPIAFDRFSRPDDSRAGTGGGSGLGLAIVHAIVTGAHGTVTLENAPEGGVRATVTLPAVDLPAADRR
jgi:signal transduction histidine kinase